MPTTTDRPTDGTAAPAPPRGRRTPPWLVLVVLVAGLAGGFLLARGTGGGGSDASVATLDLPGLDGAPPAASAVARARPVEAAVAGDAGGAVAAFLEAEVAGDHAASFAQLAAADREELGPEALWIRLHADYPPITGFEVDEVRERDGRVEVVTSLRLASRLDPFGGLVPARALGTWAVVEEDGGWRVAFTDSVIEPQHPSDEGAPAAAQAWARARQRCEEPPRRAEVEGPLLGVPAIAQGLCGAQGRVDVGEVEELPVGPDAAPFLDAYGPEVHLWSRVVPVSGEVPMALVVAPVADEWTVIGVLRR